MKQLLLVLQKSKVQVSGSRGYIIMSFYYIFNMSRIGFPEEVELFRIYTL